MFLSLKSQTLSWPQVNHSLSKTFGRLQILANIFGVCTCYLYFVFFDEIRPVIDDWMISLVAPAVISVLLILLGRGLSNVWLKDIRRFVAKKINDQPISENLRKKAEQKIVNLPAFSAVLGMINWSLAAAIVPFFITIGSDRFIMGLKIDSFLWVSLGIGGAGVVTVIMVFFTTELMCKPIWERFFPAGELIQTKGVFRLNLWQRILIIFLMGSLIPLLDMAVVSYQKAQLMLTHDPLETLQSLLFLIVFLLAVELGLVVVLSVFMSRSIVTPVLGLKSAMTKVAKGDFKARARVVDNNELGSLSLHFNQMTQGLKERYELLQTLAVAKEVQQNLLLDHVPVVPGLDMAAKSIYCDQTGGDYYDFIEAEIEGQQVIVTAVGDVSGHGIPSALLMASARAFLRQRLALPGSIDQIVNDINIQFCRDVGHSGRFMTLFLAVINPEKESFSWVRAGHDPALIYDPNTDRFMELKQKGGIPLGVDDTFDYKRCVIMNQPFQSGQILFVGTDGIWESANQAGKMFGKARVKEVLRTCRPLNADQIIQCLVDEVNVFSGIEPSKDDITMQVVKKQ